MRSLSSTLVACLLATSVLNGDDLESIPADDVAQWAPRFVKSADKIDKAQVKILADSGKANGVHVPDKVGIMVVPHKDLKEGEELAAKFKTESGAALAYLFAYHVVPVVEGKQVEEERLRTISFGEDQGNENSVYVLLLAVRQLAEDDYRLYVYGRGEKPILDARFSQGNGPGPEPVAVEIKELNKETQEGDVVITAFGKYQASFRAGYRE